MKKSVCLATFLEFLLLLVPRDAYCLMAMTKPFTLKITATLPIGGKIAPLGDMCTKSIDLLLSIVNNRSDILPNYNLIADVVDDQCQASEAIKYLFPYFLSDMHSVNMTSVDEDPTIGQYLIPEPHFSQLSATTAYIPPLLIGGMCSAVCEVAAKYVQNFNIINFSAACNSANLANRQRYPNFFRILSEIQFVATAVAFAKIMGWNKLAIISDSAPLQLKALAEAIPRFATANITIMAIEVFVDNPAESVARIMAMGARIIHAFCYHDTCPALACEASKQGLYGARIIWNFPSGRDFVNSPLPKNCTRSMVSLIDSGALYRTVLSSKYASTSSQIGITGGQLDSFLEQQVAGLWKNPFVESRMNCFDSILPAIYILDSVERTLNKGGDTLKDFIGNHSKKIELEELFRKAVSSLDITAFQAHIRYAPGEQETIVPSGILQSQNGIRRMVFRDNGVDAVDDKGRFQFVDNFIWSTPDGKMPNNEAKLEQRRRHVVPGIVIAFSTISALLIIALFLINMIHIFLQKMKTQRINPLSTRLNAAVLAGLALLLSAIIAFPVQNENSKRMSLFCQVAPVMVVVAYSLVNWGLLMKVSVPVNKRPVPTSWHKTSMSLSFSLWLLANVLCCILWYALGHPPTTTQMLISSYDDDSDTLQEDIWEICARSRGNVAFEEIFAGFLLASQGSCLLAALVLAIVANKKRKQSSETINAARAVYILIPATVVCVLSAAIVDRPDILYYIMSSIVIFLSFAIVVVLFGHRSKRDISDVKTVLQSRRQASSSKTSNKQTIRLGIIKK